MIPPSLKPVCPRRLPSVCAALAASLLTSHAATCNWNTGSGTWDTSSPNWVGAGSQWIDGSAAVFNNTSGATVAIDGSRAAASVSIGDATANRWWNFTGGTLAVTGNFIYQGYGGNWGNYPANPTLTCNADIAVTGDTMIGRANFVITGGTYSTGRIVSNSASADWARLVISGGTVTTANGIDGSTNGCVTFALDLDGGTLRTPSIRVADREVGDQNNAWLTFNGGIVQATADNPDFITLYGGNQNTYVGNGGVLIDTGAHDISINVNLLAGGAGGLTKNGAGTLALTGQCGWLGGTTVNAGVLRLTAPSLPGGTTVTIAAGAMLDLGFSGSNNVAELVLNGVPQGPGTYDATTHPQWFSGTGNLVVPAGYQNDTWPDAGDGISSFRRMKYGMIVHYVFGGTRNSDGSWPANANDLANRFDAEGLANDLHSMGVEYVIFTAWHYNMVCLWPSAAMERWMPGHTVQRDLVGDLLDAVRAKGIHVLFYTHPRDGHDMSTADQITTGWGPGSGSYDPDWNQFNRTKWNDFINDIYADLIDRYGDRIDGLFIDEGSPVGDSWRVVDYPRLRQTIKTRQPDLLMMQNFYGSIYSCDIGAKEINYSESWVPGTNPDTWPANSRPMSMVMGSTWSGNQPPGSYTPRYQAADMFRLTVLRAGVNSTDGGGINWASGPYVGGGWETGVLEQMRQLAAWIAPIRPSICNTYPSQSWATPPNATINSLSNGIVATRSAADGREFIHVLRPPTGPSLTIPAPADGRGYATASLLESAHAVTLVRAGDGSLTFTLQGADTWSPRDTVIALDPVAVTWTGTSNDAGPDTAAWADWMDNFTGGVPVASRFRSGDCVNFSGQGASNVLPWVSGFNVGDLQFSGMDYRIEPSGSPTLTLAGGRIDVAIGRTASFQETGFGGPLTLAGTDGLTKSGAGTLVLDLPSTVTGNTVLTDGVVAVRAGALGSQGGIVFAGGTLRMLPGNTEDLSSRIRHGSSPVRFDTGGNDVTWATPPQPGNTGGFVKLGAGRLTLAGGPAVMQGTFAVDAGALTLSAATGGTVVVPNSGFETPAYAPQAWTYNPANTGWTFNSSSGTAANGSPWVLTSPEGGQVAFLQNNGSMTTAITATITGDYLLSFIAANRPGYLATGLTVTLDGASLATYLPGQLGGAGDFNLFQLPAVRLTAGSHTLTFQGLQNGTDSDTLIDDVRFTAAAAGALPDGATLDLTGTAAVFDPGPATITLDSLAGVAGSTVALTGTNLVITGNHHAATFAGTITGSGTLTNTGTLRLVGDATLGFTGTLTNNGVLDIMTWNGTLPASFVNNGIVLDRSNVRLNSFVKSGDAFTFGITGFTGHNYQLQRADDLAGTWQNTGSAQPGTGAGLIFTDPVRADMPRRFYRIAVSP